MFTTLTQQPHWCSEIWGSNWCIRFCLAFLNDRWIEACTCSHVNTHTQTLTVTQSTNTWGDKLISGNLPWRINLSLSAKAEVVPWAQHEPQSKTYMCGTYHQVTPSCTVCTISATLWFLFYHLCFLYCKTGVTNSMTTYATMYINIIWFLTLWNVLVSVHSSVIILINLTWIIASWQTLWWNVSVWEWRCHMCWNGNLDHSKIQNHKPYTACTYRTLLHPWVAVIKVCSLSNLLIDLIVTVCRIYWNSPAALPLYTKIVLGSG